METDHVCTMKEATIGRAEITESFAVRTTLPLCLLASSLLMVVGRQRLTPKRWAGTMSNERLCFLDCARYICVLCVCMEHSFKRGGSAYSMHNVGFVLHWVMPYLWGVSGVAVMFSSLPLHAFLLRLGAIFAFGVSCNALVVQLWRKDTTWIVFQMGYVSALMLLTVALFPLKCLLKRPADEPVALWAKLYTGLFAASFGLGALVYVSGLSEALNAVFHVKIFVSVSLVVMEVSAVVFAAAFGAAYCRCGVSAGESWLGWHLLFLTYFPRLVAPFPQAGRFNAIKLYVVGMVIRALPLRGQRALTAFCESYFPLVFIFMLLAVDPLALGRCDLFPPSSLLSRARFTFIDVAFATLLFSNCFQASDPLGLTSRLNLWALLVFTTHRALFLLFPAAIPVEQFLVGAPTLGWVITMARDFLKEAPQGELEAPAVRGQELAIVVGAPAERRVWAREASLKPVPEESPTSASEKGEL